MGSPKPKDPGEEFLQKLTWPEEKGTYTRPLHGTEATGGSDHQTCCASKDIARISKLPVARTTRARGRGSVEARPRARAPGGLGGRPQRRRRWPKTRCQEASSGRPENRLSGRRTGVAIAHPSADEPPLDGSGELREM